MSGEGGTGPLQPKARPGLCPGTTKGRGLWKPEPLVGGGGGLVCVISNRGGLDMV